MVVSVDIESQPLVKGMRGSHSRSKSVDISQLTQMASPHIKKTFDRAGAVVREISRQSFQPMDELVEELSRPRVDMDKESHRKLMRTVYTFEDWAQHRSTHRYLRHVLRMPSSKIVRSLTVPACFVAGIVILIGFYDFLRNVGALPRWFHPVPDTTLMLQLMGTALSLLLVFRTNSSYTRWLDSRKLWGLLTNRSRDLARQAFAYIPDRDVREGFRRWIPAFAKSFKNHVRVDGDDRADLEGLLRPSEFEAIMASKHKPLFALQILAELLRRSNLQAPMQAKLDDNITQFEDILGASERILRTPLPLSYTRHTSRFMILWLLCLPFGLWQKLNWDALPATFIIAFMFLGIEEIGVLIEEPFSILPLERITETIQTNVEQLYLTYHGPSPMPFTDWVGVEVLNRNLEPAVAAPLPPAVLPLPPMNLPPLPPGTGLDEMPTSPQLRPVPEGREIESPTTPSFNPHGAPPGTPGSGAPGGARTLGRTMSRNTPTMGMDPLGALPNEPVLDGLVELNLGVRGAIGRAPSRRPNSIDTSRQLLVAPIPEVALEVEPPSAKPVHKDPSVGDLKSGDNLGGATNGIY